MRSTMLKSQFDTLEEPENSMDIDIKDTPEKIVDTIIQIIKWQSIVAATYCIMPS